MRISEILRKGVPTLSFEFFPPKTDVGRESLLRAIDRLSGVSPDFVSVTYGAGGSTRELSFEVCRNIKPHLSGEVMSHLTCLCHSRAEIGEIADLLWDAGILNIMALRGDFPKGLLGKEVSTEFSFANELMAFLRSRHAFCLGGACYPEGHKETPDIASGIEHLKMKVDSGSEFLVTQMFFDNAAYFRFVDRVRNAGISAPIIPGIMPVTGFAQLDKFENQIGIRLPDELRRSVLANEGDEAEIEKVGTAWTVRQCRELLETGAPGIHFYTLNKSISTLRVCTELNLCGSTAVRTPSE